MFPQKGTIAVGADADLVVWDPNRETVVTHAALHDAMDYTPFEGTRVKGWPVTTVSRGDVVWDGHTVRGEAGRGQFVARAPLNR
jgi:dihydropyrimidinase